MVVAGRCQVTSIRPIAAGTLDWMTALGRRLFSCGKRNVLLDQFQSLAGIFLPKLNSRPVRPSPHTSKEFNARDERAIEADKCCSILGAVSHERGCVPAYVSSNDCRGLRRCSLPFGQPSH
jgi:hypothetical protein